MVVFRRAIVIFVTGTLGLRWRDGRADGARGDPPGRVGRLAFIQGTVSFHDNEQTDWAPALVNTPVTSGDAIWTEPNAKSEISIAGTRLRMDSASQLDMLALDDTQTRMQLDQGRIDIKTFTYDTKQPYEIVTPRGTISLQQQGDYYVEAGTTEDPTRLGVRQGAAQIQTPNGQMLAVRARRGRRDVRRRQRARSSTRSRRRRRRCRPPGRERDRRSSTTAAAVCQQPASPATRT